MSEACSIVIRNGSGRALDGMLMWHFTVPPDNVQLTAETAFLNAFNGIPAGGQITAGTPLSPSPTDYWVAQILYSGDGQVYVMAGTTASPYKEFEVSDGETLTFVLDTYLEGTTNQNDLDIFYSGSDTAPAASAYVMNPVAAEVAGGAFDILTHFLGAAVGA
jgi:hypothetical protein